MHLKFTGSKNKAVDGDRKQPDSLHIQVGHEVVDSGNHLGLATDDADTWPQPNKPYHYLTEMTHRSLKLQVRGY